MPGTNAVRVLPESHVPDPAQGVLDPSSTAKSPPRPRAAAAGSPSALEHGLRNPLPTAHGIKGHDAGVRHQGLEQYREDRDRVGLACQRVSTPPGKSWLQVQCAHLTVQVRLPHARAVGQDPARVRAARPVARPGPAPGVRKPWSIQTRIPQAPRSTGSRTCPQARPGIVRVRHPRRNQGPDWPPVFRCQTIGIAQPWSPPWAARSTIASPLAIGSISEPFHQAWTRHRRGAQQASASSCARPSTARQALSWSHSRGNGRAACQPRLCRPPEPRSGNRYGPSPGHPPKGQPGNLVGLQVGQTLGDAFPHGDGMASEEAGVGTRNSVRWLTIRNNLPIKYKFFLFSDLSFIPGSVLPVPIRRRSDREPMV